MAGTPCTDLTIVLLGKTGAGKSTCGNRILKKYVFPSKSSPTSVTTKSEKSMGKVNDKAVSVIDTPGVFNTEMVEDSLRNEVTRCIELSVPGPHVFLLVIRLNARFTNEDMKAINWIKNNFGEEALLYSIVLFTHADKVKGKEVFDYLAPNAAIQSLLRSCGSRYHTFNNHDGGNDEVHNLLKGIETMVSDNGGHHYTSDIFKEAQKKLEKEKRIDTILNGMIAVGVGTAVAGGVAIAAAESVVIAPIVLTGGAVAAVASVTAAVMRYRNKKERE